MDLRNPPPWIVDPHRLPVTFWTPSEVALRRSVPPENWYPELMQAVIDQGGFSPTFTHRLIDEGLLAFDPRRIRRWKGPVTSSGHPVLKMPRDGRWGGLSMVRAEVALWGLMYPELVEARHLSTRYHRIRRPLLDTDPLDVNPWHYWPGSVKMRYLRWVLSPDAWFEWQLCRQPVDKPILATLEQETQGSPVELPEATEEGMDFEFLD